jgi:branched-chain amino acid transport system permease protein
MKTATQKQTRILWIIAGVVVLLLAAFPAFGPDVYYLSFGLILLMYIALAGSWNLMSGYTGYFSFGHAFFIGIGAYFAGWLLVKFGLSPFITCWLAGLVSAILAIIVGFPVLRLKGPYFSIATMCLSIIGLAIASNLPAITGGSTGLYLPMLDVDAFTSRTIFYEIMLALAVGITLLCRAVQKSRFGIGLFAVRENEVTAETIGVDTTKMKLAAFALSGFLAALIGGIYAYYRSYIYPETVFDFNISMEVLIMVLIGGVGSWQGPILGAIILTVINQLLTVLFPSIPPEVPRLIYGALLIVVMMFMPIGIIPSLYMKLRQQKNNTAQLSAKGS